MLYFLFVCGILLVLLSIYSLFRIEKAKDNPNYKAAKISAWICLLIGAAFVIIPRSVLNVEKVNSEAEQKKLAAQQTSKILTFNAFNSAYKKNASAFNANADLEWIFKRNENVDIGSALINTISRMDASIEQTQNQELRGIMFFVTGTNSETEMWQALFSLYTVVMTLEPTRSAESIPDFVAEIFALKSGTSITSGNLTYTLFESSPYTVVSILYNK